MKWTLTDMTRVSVMSFPSKHDATHQSRFVLHSKKQILILNWAVYTLCTLQKDFENDSQGRVGTDCLVLYTGAEFVLIPVSDGDYTTCQHVADGGHCCPF